MHRRPRSPFRLARSLARLALPVVLALPAAPAAAAPVALRPAGPPEIVIYNGNFAYVREPRRVVLAKGENDVVLEGVPQRLDSTSVRLQGPGLDVREQSFQYDLYDADKLFRRFLGDSIFFRWQNRPARGVLEGMNGDQLFIRRSDSTDVLLMVRQAQLQELELPARKGSWRFASKPSLRWRIAAEQGGERAATLSYLTSGIGWTTEYIATIAEGEHSVALSGWATIENRSGAAYDQTKVSLVAGEVHRAGAGVDRSASSVEGAAPAGTSSAADLFAYHLYAIPGRLDLASSGSLQVPIVNAATVAAKRAYRYDGARDGAKVRAQVVFGNEKGSGLGMPLPEGRVRVFAADPSGATTLVGEDRIEHTPAGAPVRLLCGVAFDLTGERTRVAHTRLARSVTEDQFRVRLRNAGPADALVTVAETLYGTWEITQKSAEYRAKDAEQIEFDVKVPARQEATLTYTVRYTY